MMILYKLVRISCTAASRRYDNQPHAATCAPSATLAKQARTARYNLKVIDKLRTATLPSNNLFGSFLLLPRALITTVAALP